jgi:hypothetical protein
MISLLSISMSFYPYNLAQLALRSAPATGAFGRYHRSSSLASRYQSSQRTKNRPSGKHLKYGERMCITATTAFKVHTKYRSNFMDFTAGAEL